ncbi:SpoIIE family protein phosphatase [Kitasatospora sp. NPDC052896]|uniref:SpoIIE family protein phosphatase n=1 Tax=Kitasatospora sp. NPDC052896 TaxID=3364061 RepID=UPI0037C6E011
MSGSGGSDPSGPDPRPAPQSTPVPVPGIGPLAPGSLLDTLAVAAIVLGDDGRIVLWSPQAEDLFGYTAQEALGRPAAKLLVDEQDLNLVLTLFAKVMAGEGPWAGAFPVRHKDGRRLLAEFRNMRLQDERGRGYALGIASERATVRRVERGLALSERLVTQSPIGLAVLDTELRYQLVNPALERINGVRAEQHLGRTPSEALPLLDTREIESSMRRVLAEGTPLVNKTVLGRTPADPDNDHAWRASYFRLEDAAGRPLGLAISVLDVTEQHHAALQAAAVRRQLALIADASVRIGTTLDLDTTARELADVAVPELADVAAVDVLESVLDVLEDRRSGDVAPGELAFRALAVKTARPTPAAQAADPVGEPCRYGADRLVTRCANTGRPVLVSHIGAHDLPAIARDLPAARLLAQAGVHSYLAVPLIARSEVLGVLDLKRTRPSRPFDHDDVLLAGELAARAAVCIDNARWYQRQRRAALTLQRHLLPRRPPRQPGLEVAYRYQPAGAAGEAGGDWFDVIALSGDRTALVVGDVMGRGINAAATMGQLRTAARTLAGLELGCADVLHHLDRITTGLDESIATCVYAVYDPHRLRCHIASAGHLPPALVHAKGPAELLDLPTGALLGVGGVPFEAVTLDLALGDQLVLYTDGLVETRGQDIDVRLHELLDLLTDRHGPLEATCDLLLDALRNPEETDDVALLIARTRPTDPS